MKRFLATALGILFASSAFAAELLPDLGTGGVLERPKGKPRGSIILMAGGDGYLGITGDGEITSLHGNSLIRTRRSYANAGFATLALDAGTSPSAAIAAMRKIAKPVIVVGTSRAATRMHRALDADGLVITSGMLDHFQSNVGSPDAMPPLLVVHHRNDGCRVTLPGLVEPFKAWGGAKVRVSWLSGGRDDGDACQGRGHHGFAGIEGQMVGAITGFARGVRSRQ
ncbi:MAG: alpha/beta hydrolase [Methylobacterium sp.]|jgi:hypothetical protein|nr:alpha/beta hydrolase [Methylobacterium sp.]MCE2932434.1 alpha/beta hydrolase [Hyphomicrobiales bacterium]MCA3636389.1 alpha/beta hydrolase [Methylobacterium sp.]MCA3640175.1 alpha/beta hydrolase [Methylobacterium sp.]MCA3647357.1 alpha/beta hydrolase [Methylobacterium sp.]